MHVSSCMPLSSRFLIGSRSITTGVGMASLLKHDPQRLLGGNRSRLWGRIRLQEDQAAVLPELGKELHGHRIVRFEAGGELIDQLGLYLVQAFLIAGKRFEFGNLFVVRG